MPKKSLEAPVGAVIAITKGEYSDFTFNGVYQVAKPFNPRALLRQWLKDHPDQEGRYGFSPTLFFNDILAKGYLKQIQNFTLQLPDGDSSEMEFTPPGEQEYFYQPFKV